MCVEKRESISTRKLVHAQRAGETPQRGVAQAHTPPGTHAPNPGAQPRLSDPDAKKYVQVY
jgi:hypothetical protein